jgi:hypothetical protein
MTRPAYGSRVAAARLGNRTRDRLFFRRAGKAQRARRYVRGHDATHLYPPYECFPLSPSRIRITPRLRQPPLVVHRRRNVQVVDAARGVDQVALGRKRIEQRLVHPLALWPDIRAFTPVFDGLCPAMTECDFQPVGRNSAAYCADRQLKSAEYAINASQTRLWLFHPTRLKLRYLCCAIQEQSPSV